MAPKLVDYLLYEPEDSGILWIKFNRPEQMNALVGTAEENGTVAKVGEYMLRIKIPSGLLTAEGVRVIAGVAERFGKGYTELTTRQNVQLHFLQLRDVPGILRERFHRESAQLRWDVGADELDRRRLGAEAFGVNWFELPPGTAGREHDERESGQEEVNVVVRGSGVWRIGDREVPVRVGTFLRFDPEQTRCPVAGPEGMTFVAVGARRGSYEPRGPF